MAQPAAHQLVHEGTKRRIGPVHRDQWGRGCAPGRLRPRLHAARRGLGARGRPPVPTLFERPARPRRARPRGRLREIAEAAGTAARCCAATRWAAGSSLQAALREPLALPRAGDARAPPPGSSPRPTASSARTPTSSWPPGWSARRSRRWWTCGSASRCSPTSPRSLIEQQRPGRLSFTGDQLARLLRTAGPGGHRAGLAPAAQRWSCRCWRWPAPATTATWPPRAAWPTWCRTGAPRPSRTPGHAAHLQRPEAVAARIEAFLGAGRER